MRDPRYYTGEPRWEHDDECSLTHLCATCLAEEEARAATDMSWAARVARLRDAAQGDVLLTLSVYASVEVRLRDRPVETRYVLWLARTGENFTGGTAHEVLSAAERAVTRR